MNHGQMCTAINILMRLKGHKRHTSQGGHGAISLSLTLAHLVILAKKENIKEKHIRKIHDEEQKKGCRGPEHLRGEDCSWKLTGVHCWLK